MAEKSNLVKKESIFYALLIGFVAGFIGGAIFAVYKLGPETVSTGPQATTAATQGQEQLTKEVREAIGNLEAQVTVNPDSVEGWTRLGHLYFDNGQVPKAIKAYERSLELQPGNADVWTDLGVMFRRNKQPQKAIEAFEHAFSLQPDHATSRMNKGIVLLYDLNKPEEAVATWEELLAMNPDAKIGNNTPLKEAIEDVKKQMQENKQ